MKQMENINKKPQRYISKFRRKTGTVFVFVFEIVEPVLFSVAAIFLYPHIIIFANLY